VKTFLVSPCPKAVRILVDIHKCLDESTSSVGSECYPGLLWITCVDEDANTVREMIIENGLHIAEEKSDHA